MDRSPDCATLVNNPDDSTLVRISFTRMLFPTLSTSGDAAAFNLVLNDVAGTGAKAFAEVARRPDYGRS